MESLNASRLPFQGYRRPSRPKFVTPLSIATRNSKTCCKAQQVTHEVEGLQVKHGNNSHISGKLRPNIENNVNPTLVDDPEISRIDAFAFQDYQFLFQGQRNEVQPIFLEVVEGSVPTDLDGTYYLQGPGILHDDYGSKVHPLDGHGYLRKFCFKKGTVEYSARYVSTEARNEEFDDEKKSWKFTYRGPFSLLKKGERVGNLKVMKNVANTSVIEWAGKLMCLWEGGSPYVMDPNSLDTMGLLRLHHNQTFEELVEYVQYKIKRGFEKHWDGSFVANSLRKGVVVAAASILQPILMGIFKMPGERMLSHVKIDEQRQRFVCITCHPEDMLLPKSSMCIYEYDKDMKLIEKKKFTINDHLMIHDWSLTENFYVLVANRVKLNSFGHLGSALTGVAPMINAIALNDSLPYTPLYLLPRTTSGPNKNRDWRVPLKIPKQFWLIHASNAFEEKLADQSTRVVFDGTACSYKWFNFANMFGYDWDRKKLDPAMMNDCSADGPMHLVRVSATFPHAVTPSTINQGPLQPECHFESWKNFPWSCDFPTINPNLLTMEHKYTYVATASGMRTRLQHFPFDTVAKISGPSSDATVASWWAGERCFVGEPRFVRMPGSPLHGSFDFEEDAGYLITVQHSAKEEICYLVVLDAKKIGQKDAMVCKLRVPKKFTFPMGFHSSWDEAGTHWCL